MDPETTDKTPEGQTGVSEADTTAPTQETPVTSPPTKPKTEEIDVSNLNQENPDTIQVDWGASDKGKQNAFMDGPTQRVQSSKVDSTPASSSSGQSASGAASFSIGIKVIIEVIDFLMSNVLHKIAGSGQVSSYTADKTSKDTLKESLELIMSESKAKLPSWAVVLLAFLSAYGFQIMNAIEARRNKKAPVQDDKAPLQPGLFIQNDKVYRRYANGSVREAKFDINGNELVIGQPPKIAARRRAAA